MKSDMRVVNHTRTRRSLINILAEEAFASVCQTCGTQFPPGGVLSVLDPLDFDRIYAGWWGNVVRSNAKEAVARSARQYFDALEGSLRPATPKAGEE
jgi:hypothetical protein